MMKRSAKGGERSSLHYEGEGVLIHPPYQGVCARHGMEELYVTPGELAQCAGGTVLSEPISDERNGKRCCVSSRTAAYYFKRGESRVTERSAGGWPGEGSGQRWLGRNGGSQRVKGEEVEQFHE